MATNPRPKKRDNIPENYWDLLEKCWDIDSHKRPSFEKIVEILKDDKFALNEYSLETNLDELHEFYNRIENNLIKLTFKFFYFFFFYTFTIYFN